MVSILAFYSDDLSSISAGYFKLYKKTKINVKEAGVDALKKSLIRLSSRKPQISDLHVVASQQVRF